MLNTPLPPDLPPALLRGAAMRRAELVDWFRGRSPQMPITTIDWRLHELVQVGTLVRVGRGHYQLAAADHKPSFVPEVSADLATLWQHIAEPLGNEPGCVWTTAWLHDWMRHQPRRPLWVVEVPRGSLSAAFYALLDRRGGGVFLEPDARTVELYMAEAAEPVLVQPLVTRAPVQEVAGTPVPRLEKLLVDVFADPVRMAAYQGAELRHIFEQALGRFALSASTLWYYAGRRGRTDELRAWLQRHPDLHALAQRTTLLPPPR